MKDWGKTTFDDIHTGDLVAIPQSGGRVATVSSVGEGETDGKVILNLVGFRPLAQPGNVVIEVFR